MDTSPSNSSEGSKYQKSLIFNPLLPYAESIDKEGDDLFHEIKVNLSIAIQKRELWPGALFWTNRLTSFLKIYGFHFTKEDHIKLVHLYYQLVTIPNLESPLLYCWTKLLHQLLKKKRLLSPSDIQFPWRPMYDLLTRVSNTKFKRLGMKIYCDGTINSVKNLITSMQCYFTPESTQEMLNEWKPLLCPFDTAMMDGMEYFAEFLPTLVRIPQDHDHTHKLWFNELLHIWLESRNNSILDESGMSLFSRLIKDTVGYIDWSPYMEQIFTRILNNFELPMGIKEFQPQYTKKSLSFPNGHRIATIIVYLLGGGTTAQDYLTKLMKSFESYYHPSNVGIHTKKLLKFLELLTSKFVLRLKRERRTDKKEVWLPVTPPTSALTETDIDSFVECLLPSLWLAIYSKLGSIEAAGAIQNLSLLRPAIILPTLMEKTYAALETLTEPHQLLSTLSCVTVVSRTLLSGCGYPEGRGHLFMLLRLAIPGIDPNDFRKMLASSLLISSLTTLVPLVDCSSAIGHVEMTELETELCSQTSQFEEFIDSFLERCFSLIDNSSSHHRTVEYSSGQGQSDTKLDTQEALIGAGIIGCASAVLSQSSPQLFQIALDKLFRFATTRVFESEVSGKMCAEMCGTAAKINSQTTLKKFLLHCIENIENLIDDVEQVDSQNPDIELIWYLQLLSHITLGDGDALLEYKSELCHCLKLCVNRVKNKTAAKHTTKAVYSVLYSLTQTYPRESSCTSFPLDIDPKEHLYIRDWGSTCHIKDTNILWHTPSIEECQFADELIKELLKPELIKLQNFITGKSSLNRDDLLLSLELINYIIQGVSTYLPHFTGPPVEGCPSSVVSLVRSFYLTSTCKHLPSEDICRENLMEFFHKLKIYLMDKCEDDTKSLIVLVNIINSLLVNHGSDSKEVDIKWQFFKRTKLIFGDKLQGGQNLIRPLIVTRGHLQHELRVMEYSMSPLTSLHKILLEDLVDLSVSMYAQVRTVAQAAVTLCCDKYLFSGRLVLPKIIPHLRNNPETSHEQFKGSLYLLLSPPLTSTVVHDWKLMRSVFIPLIQADHSEKLTVLNLISRLHNSIQKSYDTFTITFQVPDSCIHVAAELHVPLSSHEIQNGVTRLHENNQETIQLYEALINDVVTITEGQQDLTQWRFTEVSMKLLAMLIRHDHIYPTKGLQLFVNSLINDAISIRKVAIFAVTLLLQQLKRETKKIPIDIKTLAGVPISPNPVPGEREDNKWLCLFEERGESGDIWDSNINVVHKTRWGYYCYPQ